MLPVEFPESNKTLNKPAGMSDDECGPLPVYSDGARCISAWRLSLRERIRVLFTGRVWLSVYFGETQPPVAIDADKPEMYNIQWLPGRATPVAAQPEECIA